MSVAMADDVGVAAIDLSVSPPVDWPEWRKSELAANAANPRVGTVLVSETSRARVWHLTLAPGERLPYHRHVLDYFWTVTAPGRGRSYYGTGGVREMDYFVGQTQHLCFAAGHSMIHDLENVGETTLSFVTVEFMESANAPLPV
jgi:mannose-6-phosphate isomerase-like protein (cupin superfamily)